MNDLGSLWFTGAGPPFICSLTAPSLRRLPHLSRFFKGWHCEPRYIFTGHSKELPVHVRSPEYLGGWIVTTAPDTCTSSRFWSSFRHHADSEPNGPVLVNEPRGAELRIRKSLDASGIAAHPSKGAKDGAASVVMVPTPRG